MTPEESLRSVPPLRVRDALVPEHVVPSDVWADVVRRVGGLILCRPSVTRSPLGALVIDCEVCEDAVEVVIRILEEHDEDSEPWSRHADWWKQ
jgi:hypothetical protein